LLENVAANFEENRIYISRWIDLFLEHSNNVNKSYIQECLVGILHSNPVAIQATIDETKIKSLIYNFFKEAKENRRGSLTTKYLRLFSTFIRCENEVIKENQNIILNNFFKNPNNELNFKFRVEYKN
jgi:pseudouridine-5'-phosphate glycosidase